MATIICIARDWSRDRAIALESAASLASGDAGNLRLCLQ